MGNKLCLYASSTCGSTQSSHTTGSLTHQSNAAGRITTEEEERWRADHERRHREAHDRAHAAAVAQHNSQVAQLHARSRRTDRARTRRSRQGHSNLSSGINAPPGPTTLIHLPDELLLLIMTKLTEGRMPSRDSAIQHLVTSSKQLLCAALRGCKVARVVKADSTLASQLSQHAHKLKQCHAKRGALHVAAGTSEDASIPAGQLQALSVCKWLVHMTLTGLPIVGIRNIDSLKELLVRSCSTCTEVHGLNKLRKLTIIDCKAFQTAHDLPCVRQLRVVHCPMVTTVSDLPLLNQLSVSACRRFSTFTNLPRLHTLLLNDAVAALKTTRMHLPMYMAGIGDTSKLQALCVANVTGLKSITALPNLRALRVQACKELTSISGLSSLQKLVVKNCGMLSHFSNCPALHNLSVLRSSSLASIWDLPMLEELNIVGREGCALKSLEQLPMLTQLNLTLCPQLTDLHNLPSLRKLRIDSCQSLTSLSNLPQLQYLDVSNAGELAYIGQLPFLRTLHVVQDVLPLHISDISLNLSRGPCCRCSDACLRFGGSCFPTEM